MFINTIFIKDNFIKKIVLLMGILLVGCSSSDSKTLKKQNKPVLTINIKSWTFPLWINTYLSIVDMHNDDAIVNSARTSFKKVSDSTDRDGEPKKIYQFTDSVFGTQIEYSKYQIVLG